MPNNVLRIMEQQNHNSRSSSEKEIMAASCLEGTGGSLPDDIVTEILARLTMKSILRARSVCKH
ncbi:hypothetical protein SAY86_028835 [Trapa natans]|uniref:F-box domain-containing protein n=1 Tax=Trapa natans TaxID=22666 RepID=A0AAN7M195_TRANT|nr:hypothetical protein SAY86_028835 [Trapa natans]